MLVEMFVWTVADFQSTVEEACSKTLKFGSIGRTIGRAVNREHLDKTFEVMHTGCRAKKYRKNKTVSVACENIGFAASRRLVCGCCWIEVTGSRDISLACALSLCFGKLY